ncbi:MAG: ribonuclease III [Anaerolineales bacterium]|nr:ribonuclease III [Anaerolineales bacterium]
MERITGLEFSNPGLILRALTHSSYTNESPGAGENYERLEFLGDAVLDYLTAYWLYQHFPELPEGELTRMRSALVRTETLAAFAQQIGLNRILRIGKGERLSGGGERATILCGVFEAVIGAIALDRGMDAVHAFLGPFFTRESERFFEQLSSSDCKSLFQEKAQAMFGITPGYRVVEMSGPDHDKRYTIEVLVGEETYGVGTGNSKQAAAQDAARQALKKIGGE